MRKGSKLAACKRGHVISEVGRNKHGVCKACRAAYVRKQARIRYGCIDPSDELRTGNCEICTKHGVLRFDHDHATGLFRGWLCGSCNLSLGWFERNRVSIMAYVAKEQP